MKLRKLTASRTEAPRAPPARYPAGNQRTMLEVGVGTQRGPGVPAEIPASQQGEETRGSEADCDRGASGCPGAPSTRLSLQSSSLP